MSRQPDMSSELNMMNKIMQHFCILHFFDSTFLIIAINVQN